MRRVLPILLALLGPGMGRAAAAPGYTTLTRQVVAGVEAQEISYRSDGLSVRAWLFTARGEGRRPGVVFNHGGVSGVSRDMLRRSADLANAGYMVITPAYRGEGGSEGRVEVAAGEIADVLAAADILRADHRVDPARIALIGSSHGALISVLGASRDPRFAAVAEACGVMDVHAWYRYLVENGFDVSDSLSVAVYGRGPEDRPKAFEERSAIRVAHGLRAPLLIQQGMKDRTVPPDQAWRMAAALDRAGQVTYEIKTYPLLGHAFWFWDDPKSHSSAELEQAEAAWQDLLAFLRRHVGGEATLAATTSVGNPAPAPNPEPSGTPSPTDTTAQNAYPLEIQNWRADRVARLTADNGWLAVAGLYWLKPGVNRMGTGPDTDITLPPGSAPAIVGTVTLTPDDRVAIDILPDAGVTWNGVPVQQMALTSDQSGKPEVLALNDLRFFLIKRAKGYAIRLRDLNAPTRRDFTGIENYPVDASWRVEARFVPYVPAKPVEIASVIGTVDTMLSPGYVEFTRDGETWRLDPVLEAPEDTELFYIFRDGTSGVETYPPGRFLYSELPKDGRVTLDFNKAYNPPCAFTDFATCPLPPPENELKLRVTAGEKRYGHH